MPGTFIDATSARVCLDLLPPEYHATALTLFKTIEIEKLPMIEDYLAKLVEKNLLSMTTLSVIDNVYRDYAKFIVILATFKQAGICYDSIPTLLHRFIELDNTPPEEREEFRELLASPDPQNLLCDLFPNIIPHKLESLNGLVKAITDAHQAKVLDESLLYLFTKTYKYKACVDMAKKLQCLQVSNQVWKHCVELHHEILDPTTRVGNILFFLRKSYISLDDAIIALIRADKNCHVTEQYFKRSGEKGTLGRRFALMILDRHRFCSPENEGRYIQVSLQLENENITFKPEQLKSSVLQKLNELFFRGGVRLTQETFDELCKQPAPISGLFPPKPTTLTPGSEAGVDKQTPGQRF